MASLLILVAAISLTATFFVWRRLTLQHSRIDAMAFICLYCVSLGMALRFGARTYPGAYISGSPFLNDVLNGVVLFVGIGYSAVLLAAAADTVLIFIPTTASGLVSIIKSVKWISTSLATLIALYGFCWAAMLQRLP